MMRKLCPNFEKEDGLETVLEVPLPEEIFGTSKRTWQNIVSWIRPTEPNPTSVSAKNSEIQLLLGVVGAPLIPRPVPADEHDRPIHQSMGENPIEASMAKYIVQQYVAAVGGHVAVNRVESMYAMGKVKMVTSEGSGTEMGTFVLWNKRPDLWCLELMVSGCKISAGSNGKVAWRQTPWHHSHASRGPPRPLRRNVQGLDPKSTAKLFWNAICVGEKTIEDEDCFVLKLEAELSSLKARSSSSVELIRHVVRGYFSQKSGLLVHLEDSHLLKISSSGDDDIFWETTMESTISDYRTIEGVNIAHGGKTAVSLFRYGGSSETHSTTKMGEVWTIEEFDFNVKGLTMECFMPPSDLMKEEDDVRVKGSRLPSRIRSAARRVRGSKFGVVERDVSDEIIIEEEH